MHLNLELRTALNVLYLLGRFEAETADEVYGEVSALEWEDIIAPGEYLTVISHTDTPAIDNTMFANVRVKDAIVDRIAAETGRRPDSGPDRTGAVVDFNWYRRDCWLYLNTSGVKLSDRGYRKIPLKAPLELSCKPGTTGAARLWCPCAGAGRLRSRRRSSASAGPPRYCATTSALRM
jgi:putative N6-adenine-specific DNA methylase